MKSGKITDKIALRYLRRMERGYDRRFWFIINIGLLLASAGWIIVISFVWRML